MQPAPSAPGDFAPANDNARLLPRSSESFASLAERRAWLASLPMPKNDSDISRVLGCPTMARLAKENDARRLAAMTRWISLMRLLRMPSGLQAANDNEPLVDEASMAEPAEVADKLGVDNLIEFRPTVNEIMSALGRVCVVRKRTVDGRWGNIERRKHQLVIGKHRRRDKRRVGKNEIVGWYDRNSIERREGVKLGGPKGRSVKSRSAADIARYLDRPGSPFPEQWLAFDGGRKWERTDSALAAEAVLNEALANTKCMPAVKRCPTRVAEGAFFIGGVVASTGRTGGALDAAAIEAEIVRTAAARRIRSKLGDGTAAVLDLATTRMSAEQIGSEFGYAGQYARRWAVKAINAALDQIAA